MTTLGGQSLIRHIENKDITAVVNLLQTSVINLDERDEDGQTFLMIACQSGEMTVIQELLESPEVDIDAVDNDNWTALLNAAKGGFVEVVELLLDRGANIEHRDMGGWTALMWACYKGNTDVSKLLLDRGSNPNVKGEHHISCLTWAAGRGFTDIVRALLDKDARVNTADKYGTTPLIWAARKGHKEIVEMLLEEGATVDNSGMNSWTALLVAARGGYTDVVEMLLENNPNVNAVDKDGYTALTWAAKDGHQEIVYQLLQKGAYVNLPDRYGDTILIHAVKGGHREVVQSLLKKYADVDVQGVDQKTALYWAVEKGHVSIAKAILDYHADTEIPNKDCNTPLMKAVRNRNVALVEILMERGAKVSATDKHGDTGIHIAVRGRSKRIAEVLLRNPKDSRLLYKPNKSGETAYQVDSTHEKSILSQIFGARNLNAEDTSIQGYDVYSSTIADVLSDPALCLPITVGLYAKWGSGKSFLIRRLQKEMKAFTQHNLDPVFEFSVLQFLLCFFVSLILGIILTFTIRWEVGVGVGLGILAVQYGFLTFVVCGTRYRDWDWVESVSVYLARKLQLLQLLLQVLFCNQPSRVNMETAAVKFLFTDNARLASMVGEKSITGMITTLCDALEAEFGTFATRLYRVFKPEKAVEKGKFKSLCCIPYFLIVVFVLACLVTAATLMGIYGVQNITEREHTAIDSILISICIIVGIAIISNMYRLGQILVSLIISPKRRVNQIAAHLDSLKMEGFMQSLKKEVECMAHMTKCMDAFQNGCTRLVVIVDGLDSCEQERLLQVLDTVHMLFGDQGSPFITILTVDPHVIIKGIEHNMHGLFRDSSINGHDYLRNIVHLPFFLQSQTMPRPSITRYESRDTEGPSQMAASSGKSRRETETGSVISLNESRGKSKKSRTRTTESFGLGSGMLMKTSSNFDLSKSLAKSTYFSDVNPRNMRRLMNIVAVTGRLLRAYQIDFHWYRLYGWINVTEQWPYRLSWIILEIEDNEDIEDSVTLKTVYDRVIPKMPVSKEIDPLLEIDRNQRKLEIFLANHSPVLNVGDLRKFLACTINVDPYLRKLIREMQQNVDNMASEYGQTPLVVGQASYDSITGIPGPAVPPSLPPGSAPWLPRRPQSRLDIAHTTSPRATPTRRTYPQSYPTMNLPPQYAGFSGHQMAQMVSPYHMMGGYVPNMASQQSLNVGKSSYKVHIEGGDPEGQLSSMSVEMICDLLCRLEGTSKLNHGKYCETLRENNISGTVLLHCELAELKSVVKMTFGDWELFRAMIENLREKENYGDTHMLNGMRSRHTSGQEQYNNAREEEPRLKFVQDTLSYEKKIEAPKPFYPKNPAQRVLRQQLELQEGMSSLSAPTVKIKKHHPDVSMGKDGVDARKNTDYAESDMSQRMALSTKDSQWGEVVYEAEALRQAMEHIMVDSEEEEEDTSQEASEASGTASLDKSHSGSSNKITATARQPSVDTKRPRFMTDDSVESDMEEVFLDAKQAKASVGFLGKLPEEDKVCLLNETETGEKMFKSSKGGKKQFKDKMGQVYIEMKECGDDVVLSPGGGQKGKLDSVELSNQLKDLSTQNVGCQGSVTSIHSLDEETTTMNPAMSLEHINVRKANQVPDESGPSAFKVVTPGSSQPTSRAASVGSHIISQEGSMENFRLALLQATGEAEELQHKPTLTSRSGSRNNSQKSSRTNLVAPPAPQQGSSAESLQEGTTDKLDDDEETDESKELFVSVQGKTVKVSLSRDESFI